MKNLQLYRRWVQFLVLILITLSFSITGWTTSYLFILTFMAGAFFCGWICPFGLLQDMMSGLRQLLGIKNRQLPTALHRLFILCRYILWVLVFFMALSPFIALLDYDPRRQFLTLLTGHAFTWVASISIVLFTILALFTDRPFCNYFCYEGAKHGLLSAFRLFTIKRHEDSCTHCKRCDRSCPMHIQVSTSSQLRSPQCINCFRCVNECPSKGTLRFNLIGFNLKEVKYYFVISTLAITLLLTYVYEQNLRLQGPISQTSLVIQEGGPVHLYEDGIYEGHGRGMNGKLTVEVRVVSGQIVDIQVTNHDEDQPWITQATSQLIPRILKSQHADVDMVTGATYSSKGILQAVNQALEHAKEQVKE